MLLAVLWHNLNAARPISVIACPGLGTATGQVPSDLAAEQMALAYDHFLNPPARIDWVMATARQALVHRAAGLDSSPGW